LLDVIRLAETTDTELCRDGDDFEFSTEFGEVTPMNGGVNLTTILDVVN
jgi:hypothetical protein